MPAKGQTIDPMKRFMDRMKAEILDKVMMDDGYYMVPEGFVDQPDDTPLHRAMRTLRDEGVIKHDGYTWGYERWVRA